MTLHRKLLKDGEKYRVCALSCARVAELSALVRTNFWTVGNLSVIIPNREGFRSQGTRTQGEQSMKRAVRMLFLMVGLVCTYVAVAAPIVPSFDGGPIPLCNPNKANCPK